VCIVTFVIVGKREDYGEFFGEIEEDKVFERRIILLFVC
jgi:hypothetical protein